MRRFILTGTPGAGKTTLLRYLENLGCFVVEEAATDIIASEQKKGVQKRWENHSFIEMILNLQQQRQTQALSSPAEIQFFDRAPLDAYALCKHMDYSISSALLENIKKAQEMGRYEREVFFIENLGFCEPTEARKISFEDSLRFEKIHEDVYTEWGYHLIKIPRQSVEERASAIVSHLRAYPNKASSVA